MASIYKRNLLGAVTEIQNWQHQVDDAALVLRVLSKEEQNDYYRMKDKGMPDRQIWRKFHPKWHNLSPKHASSQDIDMAVESLTKKQIIALIQSQGKARLPSLGDMPKAELVALFRIVFLGQSVRLWLA